VRNKALCMPCLRYGVVVPESQKVPCLISTYQQDRFYDPAGGLLPALAKNLEGFLILVYEESAR